MTDPRAENHNDELREQRFDARDETRALGRQYGEAYFAQYGRGPYSYQTSAPYRFGESLWENYFGGIADLIVSELAPETVVDVGCAIGFLVNALRRRGVEAWGIDISEFAIEQVPDTARPFCWVGSVTDELERDYDLIVCVEVLEHLPQHLASIAISNLCRHTNHILFSASPDGFRDPTHLNVQPTEYWVELFARHGFFRNLDLDASVISPQAVHFHRAGQTAVTLACAYERWHRNTLAELRDLREARRIGNQAVLKLEEADAQISGLAAQLEEREAAAERAEAEIATLAGEVEEREAAAERAEAEIAALAAQLEEREAAAERAEAEIAAMMHTRLFRYAAPARRLYGSLRRIAFGTARPVTPGGVVDYVTSEGGVDYAIEAPGENEIVEPDLLVPVKGWVICEQDPVARIDVLVDGVECGRARVGVVRPDVAARLAGAEALISGFETLVDLRAMPKGRRRVTIDLRVETLGGARHSLHPMVVTLVGRRKEKMSRGSGGASSPNRPRRASSSDGIQLLVFTHHLGLGGGQLYLFELLRLLARVPDFAATVVAPFDGPLREATEALGIPVVVNGWHPIASIDEYEARQAEIGAWARGGGFNAVLGNTVGCFPGIDLAARLGLPALWAIHESYDLPSLWRVGHNSYDAVPLQVKRRAEDALASASAVVFEADATRELFVEHGSADRFVTIPYGIDIAAIDDYARSVSRLEARRRLGLSPTSTLLLCLGTIEPRKAQTALAKAFANVAQDNPDVTLAFVGFGSGASSVGLSEFVRKSGLGSRVRLVPITPDIHVWYRAADALVCASDIESLPRTVLEAMAFSVPVIATRVFGLPELIEDGVTGWLCEPRDIQSLIAVLERFLSTPVEERKAIADAGAGCVRARHNSRGYAETYHRLLRALIQDASLSPAQILTAG